MFHVELRQFPHVARTFNLSAEELHARVISRWVADQAIELEDRRWDPGRAKLTIYQARRLAPDELGMGRGWGTVSREGEDVTERLLETAREQEAGPKELGDVKARLLEAVNDQGLSLSQVVALAGDPTWRVSERLALAEQAVWELLHEERLTLVQDGAVAPRDRWQPTLLSWESWAPDGHVGVRPATP